MNNMCDTPDCPARALEFYDIYEQDFQFCRHHARAIMKYLPSELEVKS